ncbi:MAG: NnrS family protein [Gammaproteobacteria bacterium]|nr:NnrS family protein [Gammaproteobacteria bacterium]MCP5140023.1 NnrS family protein [Chromatiales bacterium]
MFRSSPFFSYGFRPFFLLAGLLAVLGMALWLLAINGSPWPVQASRSTFWHAHEMGLGFGGAVMAGFILTAGANWTGRPPIRGPLLVCLVLGWLCGRAAMLYSGLLPATLTMLLDLLFPVLLGLLVTREIVGARNRRNYGVLTIVWALTVFTVLYHVAAIGSLSEESAADMQRIVARLFVYLLAVLITVLGGRVIPGFTGSWLRMRGASKLPGARDWLETGIVPLTVAAGLSQALAPDGIVTAVLCISAGAAHVLRLSGWRGLATAAEPLLLVLHVAYAWLGLGFLLLGLSAAGLPVPETAALHALTVGGIGGVILGMMTRVALGHTGRPLHAARITQLAYVLLGFSALLRAFGPLSTTGSTLAYTCSGLLWIASFSLFVWHYAPILTQPRADQPHGLANRP